MKLQLIVDHIYCHIHDQFPWKWQLWLSAEFVLSGSAETKNEAIRDAREKWELIKQLKIEETVKERGVSPAKSSRRLNRERSDSFDRWANGNQFRAFNSDEE